MTRWTAILPLKLGADRKSRLAPILSPEERRRLSDRMAEHVIAELCAVGAIEEIVMLSPRPTPDGKVRHVLDQGRGLNAELDEVAVAIPRRLLVIHGDLPLVSAQDITALLDVAVASGCAIAPDRHGQGTNALALKSWPDGFGFAFGTHSFARHQQRLGDNLAIVHRAGLACDIDTPDDLADAVTRNFQLSN
jgi:2-phospho-L-lactate/phosphoenolpyruvate guanylyltransferase